MYNGKHSGGLIYFTYRSMKESRLNCNTAVIIESFINNALTGSHNRNG
jgi:hypothetical protein